MKALILLAEGFEEIEAVTVIDVLRRANVDVQIVGLHQETIKGAHGIKIEADLKLQDLKEEVDAIILPGGQPGSDNLAKSNQVKELIQKYAEQNKIISAICAAPAVVLSPTGILDGKKATCYPGFEERFNSTIQHDPHQTVIQDQNIITSRGPGTALDFAFLLVEQLKDKSTADQLRKQMLIT